MDRGRGALRFHFLFLFVLFCCCAAVAGGNGVFQVRRRFVAPGDLRAHDRRRHGRVLDAVDLPLGGLGLASDAGLYYAQIGIGSPSKNYYVQVDTGSDTLWVNCIQCKSCSSHSDLGVELTLYDLKSSHSGRLVTCDQEFCWAIYRGELEGCKPELPCPYAVTYGDGSGTNGYYVTDFVQYNQVTGNHQTRQVNASVTFGCGAQQSGDLGSSSGALDGILGFGQSNSSMISQLAASGKMRKIFAHCLDSVNGGGIFAIGHIEEPKVNTTALVPNQPHYNIIMKGIEVDGEFLRISSDIFDAGDRKGTVIDSGTTLAYLPEAAYRPLMNAIMSHQPNLNIHRMQDFLCFEYTGRS